MAGKLFPGLDYLKQRTHAQCAGLSARLEELVEEFPGGTPRDFISVLQLILGKLRGLTDQTTDAGILSWICVLVEQYLSDYLKCLDNAHTAQTPRALVRMLDKAASRLLGHQNTRLLVAPTYECNYSIDDQITELRSLLVNLLSKETMQEIFRLLPDSLFLVQFPRIERDHVLNYAIFGHELGHPLVVTVLSKHEGTQEYKANVKAIQAKLKQKQIREHVVAAYRSQQQAQDFKVVYEIYRRGITELLCDACGAFIFGPSALFAAVDHLFATRLDNEPKADEYYPPTRYRHRAMLRVLRDEGHVAALKRVLAKSKIRDTREGAAAALAYIERLVSPRHDMQVLKANELTSIAYQWIEKALPVLLPSARHACEPFLYLSEHLEKEVPELLERLSVNIPPSQRGLWPKGEPVDWRSSLVAGWLARFGNVPIQQHANALAAKAARQVNRLTMKAIEDAILARDYSSRFSNT